MVTGEEMKDLCCLGGNRGTVTVKPTYRVFRQTGMSARLETQELGAGGPVTTTGSREGMVKDTGSSAWHTSVGGTPLEMKVGP